MKFSEFVYERPDYDTIATQFDEWLHKFEQAKTAEEQNDAIENINIIPGLSKAFTARDHQLSVACCAKIIFQPRCWILRHVPTYLGDKLTAKIEETLVNNSLSCWVLD